jgi:FkbM family methyltransferase
MLQQTKLLVGDYLVRLGAESWLFQAVHRIRGRLRGFRIETSEDCIFIMKGSRVAILRRGEFMFVPFMLECYDLYFDTMEAEVSNGRMVLDFSKPGLHRYKEHGVAFYFPGIPEDEVMDAYTAEYSPRRGDVVWDAGAHAGATSYFLAQLTGPEGKVFAFEPDELNYEFLLKNIELHHLSNVIPVKKALAAKSGHAPFCMHGTTGSRIGSYMPRAAPNQMKTAPTVSIRDACKELGGVPNYIKVDIEGAEVEAIEGSLDFIKEQQIHFVFESNHRANGELTYKALERQFRQIGYEVWSSNDFGQTFTWATREARGPNRSNPINKHKAA